jgi:hypothetical protein
MDVIIACHTEFGIVKDKKVIATKETSGATFGVLNLNDVANKYGAKITYLICPEVSPYFPRGINCEIGLHIHPGWQKFKVNGIEYYAGDIYLRNNCKQSSDSSVLVDYSYEEQLSLISCGKDRLKKVLGITPKVFLAGRWSINNDTVKALCQLGFTHDCSAIAHSKKFHYDWSRLPRICMPYHPMFIDYQSRSIYREQEQSLIIVPISQMFKLGNINPEVISRFTSLPLKFTIGEYYFKKIPLLHICLHSPCMVDQFFINAMDDLLKFITRFKNINFKFVSEISV